MARRKALIIGINYSGTAHALGGCVNDAKHVQRYLVQNRGFPSDANSMVIMTDEPHNHGTAFEPIGKNVLAAMYWLVHDNNPGDSLWLSYSGHGGQVKDPDGDRESGLDDTICPLDWETNGQITSDTLHRVLVTPLLNGVRLTILFDCCHSGSAVELPYVYMADAGGSVNLLDSVGQGMKLMGAASHLLQGGFSVSKIQEAKEILGGAKSFFASLKHRKVEVNEDGLGEETFVEDWKSEGKDVWMLSGCRDDQTSADTSIDGEATGAMSYAFISTMQANPRQSYIQVLQSTRGVLKHKYKQLPQLSVGGLYDLNQMVAF
jgi:hypothetical protein